MPSFPLWRHRADQPGGSYPARLRFLENSGGGTAFTFPLAVAVAVALHLSGLPLASPGATVAACAAILLFGLPHGTLDLEIIAAEHRAGGARMMGVTALYLALAAATYLLWQAASVAALAAFLAVAAIHFAEDWDDADSAFLAQGVGIALLAAPTLLHGAEVRSLFVALAGREQAALLADLLLMLAPVSLGVAAVCAFTYWGSGRRDRAASALAALAALALLPPAAGFALFFCLLHSPRHLRAGLALLPSHVRARPWRVILPLTAAALGLAWLLFGSEARAGLPAQAVAACFMTLSILTVPHMAAPPLLARLFARRGRPHSTGDHRHADQGPSRIPA